MHKPSFNSLFVLFFAFLLITSTSDALAINALKQNKIEVAKNLNIPYENGDISVDGEINEALWKNALIVDLNIVNSPWNNQPSPVKTTAKLIENGKFLYVSFIAEDPKPDEIQGFLTDRDNAWGHDLVGIKLDTHNNRRLNYEFFVNPYGVQNDSTFNEITGEANSAWDGLWYAFGKKTNSGYQVEIAIPYNILNFKNDGQEKKWAIELVRIYPRDTSLRISHVPIDRDNPCWLCQYPEAIGFKNAKIDNNLRLTPSITATRNLNRDIFANTGEPARNWSSENEVDAGIDLRWGINTNNLFNATINPDFSTVESDSGQLNVNTNFSLYYEEKRAFFLDNSDYFSSDFNLVYTRNIADPDYGAKVTGRINKHSYGVFSTNDTETNILLSNNLGSRLVSTGKKSNSSALRYRYDYNDKLTLGSIATLRSSSDYHNYVFGVDARYLLSESNSVKAQILNSDTSYSGEIIANEGVRNFILSEGRVINSNFTDQAFKLNFKHDSEYWLVNLDHQSIGEGFRADLGFLPKTDIKIDQALVKRTFYSDEDSYWHEAGVSGKWRIAHNINNELIERELVASFNAEGFLQSVLEIDLVHAQRVGLRYDKNITDIDLNTSSFNEDQLKVYTSANLNNRTFVSLDLTLGDKIDYSNDRLGDLVQVEGNITVFITDHLEFDFYQTYSKLNAKEYDNKITVYKAYISELRLSYQFDVQSYLKLSLVYNHVDYPGVEEVKDFSTQLIYAYKLNPQTVFFLGYADSSFQDNDLTRLTTSDRTLFTKFSYAWSP